MSQDESRNPNREFFARLPPKKRHPIRHVQRWIDRQINGITTALYRRRAHRLAADGVRFLRISHPARIGHLAAEIDWYLKKVALGDLPDTRAILVLHRRRAANRALLDVFRPHIEIIDRGLRFALHKPFRQFEELELFTGAGITALEGPAEYAQLLNRWQPRPGLFSLTDRIEQTGHDTLARMGVPRGAWFVCLHAREGGYSTKDEPFHRHRNSDIETYRQTAEMIAARGGWTIRMGDPTMRPLEAWPNTVDYAVSDLKSPEMDVFLCARARMFLGNTSGLCMVANIFDVPCALVNMIPYGAGMGVGPRDLAIPKLMRKEGRVLSFPEIMHAEIANYRMAGLFEEAGLEIIDNSAEEIAALARQMLDRINGTLPDPEASDTQRQQAWHALKNPSHYCYHAAGEIGRDFLRQHARLMDGA